WGRGRVARGDGRGGWGSARVLVKRARRLDHHAGADAAIVAAVRAIVATRQAAVAPSGVARGVIVAATRFSRGGAACVIYGRMFEVRRRLTETPARARRHFVRAAGDRRSEERRVGENGG